MANLVDQFYPQSTNKQPNGVSNKLTVTPGTSVRSSILDQFYPTPVQTTQPEQKKSLVSKVKEKVQPFVSGAVEQGKAALKVLPGYIKAAVKEPLSTAAGAGTKVATFFAGDVAGNIQQGIASVTHTQIPERWDLKKQAKAFEALGKMQQKDFYGGEENVKAFETGKFIGEFVPYYFAGALIQAGIGAPVLAPFATKFAPKIAKLVPRISDLIGFTGVGQLEYDKEMDGSRVDRIKTDIIMLGLFEAGGILAKGLSKGTSKLVKTTVNEVSGKFKSSNPVALDELENTLAIAKDAITKDTGKPASVILANNITKASDKELKTISESKILSDTKAEVGKTDLAQEAEVTGVPSQAQKGVQGIDGGVVKPKEVVDGGKFTSRVFERMKAEHPDILEGDLTATHIKLKADSERAVNLIAKDKQQAFDIAMGREASKDVTSTATNIALAEKALDEGNRELYAKLINNRSLEQTRRGQEIVSERGSMNDNSTSRYVKELISAKLDNVGKRYLSDLRPGKVSDKTFATEVIDRKVGALEAKIQNNKLDVRTALKLLDELACI